MSLVTNYTKDASMPPFMLPAMVLAPFYLIFTHDSDFQHKTIIPMYSSMDECNKQAQEVDAIMQGRTSLSLSRMVSNSNPHAFCIATGWTLKSTGGAVWGMNQLDEKQPPESRE